MQNATNMKNNYMVYIVTTFETEIEREFKNKKDMYKFLSNELFVQKEMNSICVLTFKIDSEGYKTTIDTKYSFDKRFA
jgi:hypothetical protein